MGLQLVYFYVSYVTLFHVNDIEYVTEQVVQKQLYNVTGASKFERVLSQTYIMLITW